MTAQCWDLPRAPASAGEARAAIRRFLAGLTPPVPEVDGPVLAVSELVTNAILHARDGGSIELRAEATGGVLHIEVSDHDRRPPAPRDAGAEDENGRGLAVVEQLSTRWGWTMTGSGKHCWCDMGVARTTGG